MNIKRGAIISVDFEPTQESEIRKTRPAVVVSNEVANAKSSLLTVVPLTPKRLERIFPFEVFIERALGLTKPSKVLCDQVLSIDRNRVKEVLGKVSDSNIKKINSALALHLDLILARS